MIDLISKDGKVFTIQRCRALLSGLRRAARETDPAAPSITCSEVSDCQLEYIVSYMNQHPEDEKKEIRPCPELEKPLQSKVLAENMTGPQFADFQWILTWLQGIMDKEGPNSRQAFYDLMLAANYLDLKSLVNLGAAWIATWIKGVPLADIKAMLAPTSTQPLPPLAANPIPLPANANANGSADVPVAAEAE